MATIEVLQPGVYAITPYIRLFRDEAWEGWTLPGSHQNMTVSPDETDDYNSPNRTDIGSYGLDVFSFSLLKKKSPYVLEFDNPSEDIVAMSLSAALVKTTVAAGTGVTVTRMAPAAGGYIFLDKRGISSDVMTRTNGDSASDWVTETVYAVGDFHVPTTPNAHFYECTIGGTSDVSEPTQTTDGSTFADATVTWIDRGLILAATTDYSVANAEQGQLATAKTGGSLVQGEPLSIEFDHGEAVTSTYRKGKKFEVYGQFRFEGYNLIDDTNEKITGLALWCKFKGMVDSNFAAGDAPIVRKVEIFPEQPDFNRVGLEKPEDWIGDDAERYVSIAV